MAGTINYDVHYPFSTIRMRLVSRHPVEIRSWANVVFVFEVEVWVAIIVSLLMITLTSYTIYVVYGSLPERHIFLALNDGKLLRDFFFNLLGSLTEPGAYPWFNRKAAAGNILVLFWATGVLILNLAYCSIMRSHLIKPALESQVNSAEDVLERQQNIYLFATTIRDKEGNVVQLNDWVFQAYDKRLVEFAKGRDTLRGYPVNALIENDILNDVLNNGAIAQTAETLFRLQALSFPAQFSKLRMNGEEMFKGSNLRIFAMRKFNPWREDLDLALMKLEQNAVLDRLIYPPLPFDIQNNPNVRILSDEGTYKHDNNVMCNHIEQNVRL